LVRIKPFKEDCKLPFLPGKPPLGGHPLSHDQVEATLMRRAGYEVRVLPQEGGSWEENPPTMLDYSERDLRWCQGNMQYVKLLGMPGLKFMSRFQLVWAILMFIGIPALTLMIALTPIAAWQWSGIEDFPSNLAAGLYVAFLLLYLSPKIAGLLDAILTPGGVARYGGPLRFAASAFVEIMHSFLQGAVSTIRLSIFMIGLAFGQSVTWSGQSRDAHGMSWATGVKHLWPQTLFGAVVCGAMIAVEPAIFWWSLPLTAGYLLAIPFSVLTASPWLGSVFKRWGLCGIPEDFDPPPEIKAIATKV
jgi:membrane glycosyltransferase